MRHIPRFAPHILMLFLVLPLHAQEKEASVETILNWHEINDRLFTAGQPGPEHMTAIKARGVQTIISLATPSEANLAEANRAAELGMAYITIPFGDDGPTPDDVEWFNGVMKAQEGKTVLVHCNTNRRASSFTFLYQVLVEGRDPAEAIKDVEAIFDPEQSATWKKLFEQMLPPDRSEAIIVQPGAPGQDLTFIEDASDLQLAVKTWTEADVAFMQGMIHHHAQALEMVELMDGRTTAPDLLLLGKRIAVSQESEIRLMRNWLHAKGQEAPGGQGGMSHATHASHVHGAEVSQPMMPGMLSAEQMQQLRDATGDEFYRLWVTFMIQHHEGALTMVEHLMAQPGAAQDQDVFHFASEVDIDQRIEILRMRQMLARVGAP